MGELLGLSVIFCVFGECMVDKMDPAFSILCTGDTLRRVKTISQIINTRVQSFACCLVWGVDTHVQIVKVYSAKTRAIASQR